MRSDFNVVAPGEWALRNKDWIMNEIGGVPTGDLSEGGYNVFNIGVALNIFSTTRRTHILYVGGGVSQLEYFERYSETYTGPYYAKHSSENISNINFGILIQKVSGITYQLGFDTAVPGFN